MSHRELGTALLVAVLVLGASARAADEGFQLMTAGRVYLDDIVLAPEGDEIVELLVRVETMIGEPIAQLRPSSLSIRDNGELIEPSRIELSLLSESGQGASVVLVLDTSRTMRGESFDQARRAALEFVDRMGDFDHMAAIAFDDDVRVVADFGAPRTELRLALEQLEVEPKTLAKLVWDSAHRAIEMVRTRPEGLPRRSLVVLFSDGRDSNSIHDLAEVVDYAQGGVDAGRVPVFTIGYSRFGESGLSQLDALSHGTGGSYFRALSPSELSRFFDEIWKRTTRSFVIRYSADLDGARHLVEVSVGERSDSREADYPDIGMSIWPWLLGVIVLLGAGAGVFVFLRGRNAGRLVFENGPRSGQAIALRNGKLRLGALEENDLVLNLPEVSRYHAQIHVKGGRVEIEDLGSKNGTLVNGTPIRARSQVVPGDRLRLGSVELIYRK